MIEAKLKGEGLDVSEPQVPKQTNVVDLMAALGQATEERKPAPPKKRAAATKVAASNPPQAASAKRKRA